MSYNSSNIKNSIMRSIRHKTTSGKYAFVTVPEGVYASITFLKNNTDTGTAMINLEVIGNKIIYLKSSGSEGQGKINLFNNNGIYCCSCTNINNADVYIDFTYSEAGECIFIEEKDNPGGGFPTMFDFNRFYFFNDVIASDRNITADNIDVKTITASDIKTDSLSTNNLNVTEQITTNTLSVHDEINTDVLNAEEVTINNLNLRKKGEIAPSINIEGGSIELVGTNSKITVSTIETSGKIVAGGSIDINGDLTTSNMISAEGSITSNSSITSKGEISATSNLSSGGDILSNGAITANGEASSISATGNISTTGSISANGIKTAGDGIKVNGSNISIEGDSTTYSIYTAGNIYAAGNIKSNAAITSSSITTTSVESSVESSINSSGSISASGDIKSDKDIISNANITANSISSNGNITTNGDIKSENGNIISVLGGISAKGSIVGNNIQAGDLQIGSGESYVGGSMLVETTKSSDVTINNVINAKELNTTSISCSKIIIKNKWQLNLDDSGVLTINTYNK